MFWTTKRRPPRRNTPGFVYILTGDNGNYKIGSTTRMDRRVWEVSHYSGIKSELYFYVETDDMNDLENRMHKQFRKKRVVNEWFSLTALELASAVQMMHRG
jgi:predicted GIY-YIG superfamily endonuclease